MMETKMQLMKPGLNKEGAQPENNL